MKKSLFITGATGFIGSSLLESIDLNQFEHIYCLGRKENDVINKFAGQAGFTFIKADLSSPESYARYLELSDVVLHLAGLTGKAGREEYFRVNSSGTRVLLEQCVKSNMEHFIFISSIAAGFENTDGYHYAHSKLEAERLVEASGLAYTIIRPAMVIGKRSPVLEGLLKLAKAPLVPIFGNGKTKIEPVYVEDLSGCILSIIENSLFRNQTLTITGPEQITIEDFISRLHGSLYNKKPRLVHLPVRPIVKMLLFFEKFLLAFLPFTAGQMATFTNDGIADNNAGPGCARSRMKNIDEMLALSLSPGDDTVRATEDLERECVLLTGHLINMRPDAYMMGKYVTAHRVTGLESGAGSFDRLLISAANSNAFFMKLADAYTAVFYKNAVLRKKLLLVLAILECCGSTFREVDSVSERSAAALYIRLMQRSVLFVLTLAVSIMAFSPLRFFIERKAASEKRAVHG